MPIQAVRPDVSNLVYRLYSRGLHPELSSPLADNSLCTERFSARLQICDAGHIVAVKTPCGIVTEVITTVDRAFPHQRQVLTRRLRGSRDDTAQPIPDVTYRVSLQVEKLDPDVYTHLQTELLLDTVRCRVHHLFSPSSRMSASAISLLHTETTPQSLLIHSFHTFPDNSAVVKSQSLFEFA